MGLPTEREHTYGTEEPVRSVDLNAIQDAIIDLHEGSDIDDIEASVLHFTTALQLVIPAMKSTEVTPTHTKNVTAHAWIGWTLASSVNPIAYPVELPVGYTITSWSIFLKKTSSGTQTHTGRLYRTHSDGTEAAILVGDTNNQNAPGDTFLSENGVHVIEASYQYYLVLTPAAGGAGDIARHARVSYTYPRP